MSKATTPRTAGSIVILGGGFAGIRAALELTEKLKNPHYQIILVSNRTVAVYNADLYEIATAFHKKITDQCLTELRETVAVPYRKIFHKRPIKIIKDEVLKIHPEKNTVTLKETGDLEYEFLVVALGSVSNYYDIPGLPQFSYPLKTLQDALAINCHLDSYFQNLWKKEIKKKVHLLIGGGGFTGVEFACELPGYLKRLCKKYHYPRSHVELTLIEGNSLLGGQGEKMSHLIIKRLKKFHMNIMTETLIKSVEANTAMVQNKEGQEKLIEMDMLIWTGGVKPNPVIQESFSQVAKNGALAVNEFLQHGEFQNIFAAGDSSFFLDPKEQKPAPMLAQVAVAEGPIIAHNIVEAIAGGRKEHFKKYELKLKGIIIPLGGKYAICKRGEKIYQGFWCWVLRRLVDLKYALSILPFFAAIKKWIHSTNIFVEND